MEEKESCISIRVNKSDRNLIEAKASKFRMKPSSFVRSFVLDTDRFVANDLKIENQKLKDELLLLSKKIDKLTEYVSSLAPYIVKSSVTTSIFLEMPTSEEKKIINKKLLDSELEDAKFKNIIK